MSQLCIVQAKKLFHRFMHSVGFIQLLVAVLIVIFANSDQKGDFFLAGSDLFPSFQKVMASYNGLLVWLLVSL